MVTRNVIPFSLPGFEIDEADEEEGALIIKAHAITPTASCPDCGVQSSHVHSYYTRSPRDLPCGDRDVQLELRVRRFRCINSRCPRKTFAERLPGLVPVYGRRTERLTAILRKVSFELGGEAGARVTRSFRVATSADTLLRIIRRTRAEPPSTPRVLGVDDWAKRKGHSYGTLLVDLGRHRPVDLLPDREAETLAAWLQAHPGVAIISRDRAHGYIDGATQGAPDAVQIADRWHLLKNLGEALQKVLERHPKALRLAAQKAHEQINALPPTTAEATTEPEAPLASSDQKTPTRRQRLYAEVKALAALGYSKRAIARQLHMHRETVDRYIHADELPRRLAPQNISTVTPYRAYIERRWKEGCQNGRQLWQEIQVQGYTGSYASVNRLLKRFQTGDGRRRQTATAPPPRPLSARQAMWLLTRLPKDLTDEQHLSCEVLCACCPEAAEMYLLAQRFVKMLKERQADALDPWLEDAQASSVPQLRNFAAGLRRDYAAVKAALAFAWSNGQVEGQVNRLKAIKRQMYGRAKFDLLRQRVLYDTS